MKIKIFVCAIAIVLCAVLPVSAAEKSKNYDGEISVKGVLLDLEGNKAKFNEYRDIHDGMYTSVKFNYDNDNCFLNFKAKDIGYETGSYKLDGGLYGAFNYKLIYDELPHNYDFGARSFEVFWTPNSLVYGRPPLFRTLFTEFYNVGLWNLFDYQVNRAVYGADIKVTALKPFTLEASAHREKKEGIKATGAALGSPGNPALELPQPVDYRTDTFNGVVSYDKKPFNVSLGYTHVNFINRNQELMFVNPLDAIISRNQDMISLPPNNDYNKIALKGRVLLPLNSSFNVNLATTLAESTYDLASTINTSTGTGVRRIQLSDSQFNGEVKTNTANFVLASNPVSFLDVKMFYKFYEKKNESDQIKVTDGTTVFVNELFGYRKNNAGVEVGVKLPAKFKLDMSYNYLDLVRERSDAPSNIDNTYTAQLKWTGLSFLTAKAGYEKLHRVVDSQPTILVTGTQEEANMVSQLAKKFDVAPGNFVTYKAEVDINPINDLNFGLGYKLKKEDYEKLYFGLKDRRLVIYTADFDYTYKSLAKVSGYFDYERNFTDQMQRRYAAVTAFGNPFPISGIQDQNNYNWSMQQKERTYEYGAALELYPIKKLSLKLSHDYLRSDGLATTFYYSAPVFINQITNPPLVRTNDNQAMDNWDDYKLRKYTVKAAYDVTNNFKLGVGWTQEKYTYADASVDGYVYVVATTPPGAASSLQAFLTGAGKDPSYKANIYYTTLTYRF